MLTDAIWLKTGIKTLTTNWFLYVCSLRFVRLAQKIVRSSHHLYEVIALRSSEKTKSSNGNSGIYSRGIGTAGVWLCWLLYLLVLVPPAAGAPPSGSSTRWLLLLWILGLGRLVVAASARLPTRCLARGLARRGRREASPFQTRVNKPCSPGWRLSRATCPLLCPGRSR